jgi:hypothetical protein
MPEHFACHLPSWRAACSAAGQPDWTPARCPLDSALGPCPHQREEPTACWKRRLSLTVCFAMNFPACRTCRHCRQQFLPDYRNAYHQRFCSKPDCQHASKQTSQHRWLRKPQNRNYFREPDNGNRVREWRLAHPGYWRTHRQSCPAPPGAGVTPASSTLQDVCRLKLPVLTGLLSRLGCCTLQEDIANCAREMVSEAQCILLQCQSSFSRPAQASGAVNHHESG